MFHDNVFIIKIARYYSSGNFSRVNSTPVKLWIARLKCRECRLPSSVFTIQMQFFFIYIILIPMRNSVWPWFQVSVDRYRNISRKLTRPWPQMFKNLSNCTKNTSVICPPLFMLQKRTSWSLSEPGQGSLLVRLTFSRASCLPPIRNASSCQR